MTVFICYLVITKVSPYTEEIYNTVPILAVNIKNFDLIFNYLLLNFKK